MSLADVGSAATAAGVAFVVLELVLGRLQGRTALEDELTREYRAIAQHLPVEAFFDIPDAKRPLPPFGDHLQHYVRYLDLCNQQTFLRMQGRVSSKTWAHWADGIRDNLERDGFTDAWRYVRRHSRDSYHELASLYGNWDHDPAWWSPRWRTAPVRTVLRKPRRPAPWTPDADPA